MKGSDYGLVMKNASHVLEGMKSWIDLLFFFF